MGYVSGHQAATKTPRHQERRTNGLTEQSCFFFLVPWCLGALVARMFLVPAATGWAIEMEKRWEVVAGVPAEAEALARAAGIAPLTAQVLCRRGVTTPEAVRGFLHPSLSGLHDPFLLGAMAGAADRVVTAVERGEPIVIYGDYDVDGITATAILLRCLKLLGAEGSFYIPDRL